MSEHAAGHGTLWPMPITLDVTEEFAKKLTPGSSKVALRDAEGVMLGKSTTANVLHTKFFEMGGRPVTLLDGDVVRKHLSSATSPLRLQRTVASPFVLLSLLTMGFADRCAT